MFNNYNTVKFGQQRYVQTRFRNTECLLCPGGWRSRKLSQKSVFCLFLGKVLQNSRSLPSTERGEGYFRQNNRCQSLEADPVFKELPIYMAQIKIYQGWWWAQMRLDRLSRPTYKGIQYIQLSSLHFIPQAANEEE